MNADTRLAALTDDELLSRLRTLVERSCRLTAEVLAHLGEVEARQLHLREACSSMFVYCREVLHLSDNAAYKRIHAARAARAFPAILARVAAGQLHLAAVCLLAPHLTVDNHAELLAAASHRSKRELERLLAERFPRPDASAGVRGLPAPSQELQLGVAVPASAGPSVPMPAGGGAPPAPARYQVQFTADQALRDKLDHTQALLRHQIPDGNLAAVIDRALTLLVADLERKKAGKVGRPRAGQPENDNGSRHVPADVRRTVWERDEAQCAYVSPDGRRCTERGFLELHHIVPYAANGPTTVANMSLRCALCRARHKAHYAERRIMPRTGWLTNGAGRQLRGIIRDPIVGHLRLLPAVRRAGGRHVRSRIGEVQGPAQALRRGFLV